MKEYFEKLKGVLGNKVKDFGVDGTEYSVLLVDKKLLKTAAEIIRQDFDVLFMLAVADYKPKFELNYVFSSYDKPDTIVIRTYITDRDYSIDTLTEVFDSANWEEREAYDLFGIKFNKHPDLRRILLPEDWPGHPLRKDFVVTDEVRNWTGLDLKF